MILHRPTHLAAKQRAALKLALPLAGVAALVVPFVGITPARASGLHLTHHVARTHTVKMAHIATARPTATSTGNARTGRGAPTKTPICTVTPAPSSEVEAGLGGTAGSVAFVLEVACQAAWANTWVTITSPGLYYACNGNLSWYDPSGRDSAGSTVESFNVQLDDAGNATAVVFGGPYCTPGTYVVDADMDVAPYKTPHTDITIVKPTASKSSLSAFPASEVEDDITSSVAAIFYAEFPSVYSEHTVQFSDGQLAGRCGVTWYGADAMPLGTGAYVSTTLDDQGNAWVVALAGPSCATGSSSVEADLVGPPATQLFTTFKILAA